MDIIASIKKERNLDLLEAYDRELKKLGKYATRVSHKSIVELAVNSASKQYYVTLDEAMRRISYIEKHGDSKILNPEIRKMYDSIYSKYILFKAKHKNFPKSALVQMAIDSPAEKFFLDIKTATLILRNMLKNEN